MNAPTLISGSTAIVGVLVIMVILGLAQLLQLWLSALTGNRQTLAVLLPALISALLWPWVSFGLRGLSRRYKIN